MARYNFREIELKWQKYWQDHQTFKVTEDENYTQDKRFYVLDMFPYPSGSGLHLGHPEGYTATDIYVRYLRANGYNVLHPMGFDSFGLPAENYAIKTGTHPLVTTEANIEQFRRQIKAIGLSYDWDREVATHSSDYYRWTQWIFLQLYKEGLAYENNAPINWCPSCLTGLANEEVTHDGCCDRCGTKVVRKMMRQWMLKITAYAEELLSDLELVDWPESVKAMQRNWIGKSEGANVHFNLENNSAQKITVYTTRPDTLFGVSYLVLAPEHELVDALITAEQSKAVAAYKEQASMKSDLARTDLAKEKTGVFTGSYAINPVNNEKVPIWISDYVLVSYGTGAVMAVPAHDERDYDFAQIFQLPITVVVEPLGADKSVTGCFSGYGKAVNSGFITGEPTPKAKQLVIAYLEEHGYGEKTINYKLRDWLFSRQRYWGEPIPIVHCPQCGIVPVAEADLPVTLPKVDSYKPTGTGESPLAIIDSWVNTSCPRCGQAAKRETNTMPQWAGSCWYYLRYIDPHNEEEFCSKEKERYWMPVGLYVGGAEHAVLHLLYSRFWHKVLHKLGYVTTKEPFLKLINQGMILGEDHQKMSKSSGNGVNPDDMIAQFGSDSLRIYEMFMGPLQATKPWNVAGIAGINRFLGRVWDVATKAPSADEAPLSYLKSLHQTIKKVTEDTAKLEFNTAISQMMIFINEAMRHDVCYVKPWASFVKLLAPYAPHLGEELWSMLGYKESLAFEAWPTYEAALLEEKEITLGVQVNGKVRAELTIAKEASKEELVVAALALERIKEFTAGKELKKVIAIPGKIVNIVIA